MSDDIVGTLFGNCLWGTLTAYPQARDIARIEEARADCLRYWIAFTLALERHEELWREATEDAWRVLAFSKLAPPVLEIAYYRELMRLRARYAVIRSWMGADYTQIIEQRKWYDTYDQRLLQWQEKNGRLNERARRTVDIRRHVRASDAASGLAPHPYQCRGATEGLQAGRHARMGWSGAVHVSWRGGWRPEPGRHGGARRRGWRTRHPLRLAS